MEQLEFHDVEEYPVEFSAGGINAYAIPCEIMSFRPGYCVCVNKLDAYKRGRRDFLPECVTAIGNGTCDAIAMRNEEIKAGKAIYFVHREKLLAFQNKTEYQGSGRYSALESLKKKLFGSMTTAVSEPAQSSLSVKSPVSKSAVSKSAMPAIDTGGYADAINSALTEKTPLQPEVKVEAKPGESLLEMARRLMSQNTQGATK